MRLYPVENGELKYNQEAHAAVVDLDVLRDQECADSLMRLWAEFLWASGKADGITFLFLRGDTCSWKDWREGRRFSPGTGERIQGSPDASRDQFMRYLGTVMKFANTASLKRDLEPVDPCRFFNSAPMEKVMEWIRSRGEGLYIVGLDIHVAGDTDRYTSSYAHPIRLFHTMKMDMGNGRGKGNRTSSSCFRRGQRI